MASYRSRKTLTENLVNADFLKEREKDMLKMRLGMDGYRPATLQEIADKYNITRERIRQIGVSISKRVKKNMPDSAHIASGIFVKAWVPKYMIKKKQVIKRKAAGKRRKTLLMNRAMKMGELINEYTRTNHGKEKIDAMFRGMRVKFRKNKSLFNEQLIIELRNLRKRFSEAKRTNKKFIPPINPALENLYQNNPEEK